MMATMQDFGGLLFGQGGSGLEEYLTPQQTQGIQNQAMLQAAAALLSAGGPSARPVSLGQALGGALQAGQQGYSQAQQGAIQNVMVRQKLEEAQRERQLQQLILGGGGQVAPSTPMATTPAEPVSGIDLGGRGAAPNSMMGGSAYTAPAAMPTAPAASGGNMFSKLSPEQRAMVALSTKTMIPKLLEEELKRESFNMLTPEQATAMGLSADGTYQQNARTGQVTAVTSAEATPTEVRLLKATNTPVTLANIMAIRRSGAANVNMGDGQKGFDNEVSLKKMFSSEPIYKDYSDMKTAFNQVQSSLKQENPIGDVAAATKIMKLLDPGSVVRESELGIAMAATGKMDRLQNYVQNWANGTRLTPTQRQDFQNLATELYAAAGQSYNAKRNEFIDLGGKYNLDATKALGAPATIPSLMKNSGALTGGGGGDQRKPLGSIFGPR
jgi:Spy/CpxP family protein refolding chaperone